MLDGLDPSLNLHLPASRLPTPPSAPAPASHQRRVSSGSLPRRSSSVSLALNALDPAAHPVIRRSFRRVLGLRSALHVRMRTVACPVSGLGVGTRLMPGMGMDKSDEEGIVMCVEVVGLGDGRGGGFEVEGVEVEVTGGVAGSGDVEVKAVEGERDGESLPLTLEAADQHNFLYAITVAVDPSASPDALRPVDGGDPVPPPAAPAGVGASVPIHVATSPSQRFAAKFGDEPDRQHERLQHELPKLPPVDQAWLRNVAITVYGRPTSIGRPGEGYSVPGSVSLTSPGPRSGEVTFPTESFASKWNCTLDVSPFATRQTQQSTAFSPPELGPPPILAFNRWPSAQGSLGLARPLHSTSSLRTSIPAENIESVAGSHRHTVGSLQTLASKSPYLARAGRPEPLDLSTASQDRLAVHPNAQTPGATGPSRRFFSLPTPSVAGGEIVGTPTGYGPGTAGFDWARRGSGTPAQTPTPTPAFPPHRAGSPEVGKGEVVTAEEAVLRRTEAWDGQGWDAEAGEDGMGAPECV